MVKQICYGQSIFALMNIMYVGLGGIAIFIKSRFEYPTLQVSGLEYLVWQAAGPVAISECAQTYFSVLWL